MLVEVERELVQLLRTIFIGAFVLNIEVLGQCVEELAGCHTIQVAHHAVVVEYGELACREAHGHEVVVFLVAAVVGVLLCTLSSHKCGCCAAMMAVGYVECGHFSKLVGDGLDVFVVGHTPQSMTESVDRCHKVVFRFSLCISVDELE